eukprot:GHVT01093178.1.p1 GENE.GHVT01093178.1~~GHVT01093178.1.p1  ORF type:complete len:100 (+),score=6.72 GHVT01093178.1:254-553(+)
MLRQSNNCFHPSFSSAPQSPLQIRTFLLFLFCAVDTNIRPFICSIFRYFTSFTLFFPRCVLAGLRLANLCSPICRGDCDRPILLGGKAIAEAGNALFQA